RENYQKPATHCQFGRNPAHRRIIVPAAYNERLMRTIYLDNNVTTRLDPVVADAMTPWLGDRFAHPSSIHAPGQAARHAIESARQTIGEFNHCAPYAVLLTASGTQADQLAILGALHALPVHRRIVTTTFEHSAVLNLCRLLES